MRHVRIALDWIGPDHPLWNRGPVDDWRALVLVMSRATWHKRTIVRKGLSVELVAGEVLTSPRMLARDFLWTRARVRRWLARVVDLGYLELVSKSPAGTVYRVLNPAIRKPAQMSEVVSDDSVVTATGARQDSALEAQRSELLELVAQLAVSAEEGLEMCERIESACGVELGQWAERLSHLPRRANGHDELELGVADAFQERATRIAVAARDLLARQAEFQEVRL